MVEWMYRRPWRLESDPKTADFIIETERAARNLPVVLINEVRWFDCTFAWIYARQPNYWPAVSATPGPH